LTAKRAATHALNSVRTYQYDRYNQKGTNMTERIDSQQGQPQVFNVDMNGSSAPEIPMKARAEAADRSEAKQKIISIPLSLIDPFPEHPLQVRDDAEMENLIQSICEHGVLAPAIVREKGSGRYELVSGHRGRCACEMAGVESMPVIVRELSDDDAAIVMCDSNLQREKVLPSEKAYAYKMKMDALRQQGKRNDLTSTPVVRKSVGRESAEIVGEAIGDSQLTGIAIGSVAALVIYHLVLNLQKLRGIEVDTRQNTK
jgi:hypothetical protein